MSWDKLLGYNWEYIAFWLKMAGLVLFATISMICIGAVWYWLASKSFNCFYGYRTACAKRDASTWKYVNRAAGRAWMMVGIFLLLMDSYVMLSCMHGYYEQIISDALALLLIELLAMVCCHLYTRYSIKKKYRMPK